MFAASKSGSVDAKDPQFNYVTMLLHGDGTNGAQNNTFLDSSTNNFTITSNGNTTQGTFTPYGSNWSNYFDGSGDYLSVADNAVFDFGSGNFTIEAWANFSSASQEHIVLSQWPGANNRAWVIAVDASAGSILFAYTTNGTTQINVSASFSFKASTWYHLAVCRDSTNLRIFVNGTLLTTYNISTSTIYNSSASILVGAFESGSIPLFGYVSNVRLVKGTAVYTTAFTPSTTPLTAISGTSLLTCQSNRFIDNSTNNFTITKNGDTSVQRFSPFSPTTAYSTSVIGGSGYFDGTGDYLTELTATTALNLSSGDWSISFWVYKTATANGSIVNLYNSAGNTSGLSIWIGSSGVKVDNGISGGVQAGTVVVNAWSYIEVIRSSGTTTIYVNGVSAGTTTQTPNASQFGSFGSAADGTLPHQGYITDLRIVKGTALSSSVPTAPLTAITNTSLLLNYTNAGILDNAMMNDLETVGNAQISTSVKKYGTGSIAFDGSGDYLTTSLTPNLQLAGDFTVECWTNLISRLNTQPAIFSNYNSYTTGGLALFAGHGSASSTQYQVAINGASFPTIQSTTAISYNTWVHLAVVRSSGVITLYVNGVANGTYSTTAALNGVGSLFAIGTSLDNVANCYINGYIDDLRISKVARYTANFTAPTTAFADKG
jgi:hypothetical protein